MPALPAPVGVHGHGPARLSQRVRDSPGPAHGSGNPKMPARSGTVSIMADGGPAEDAAYVLHRGNALDAYSRWPVPATIVSDGAYGVRGFHGDTTGADGLVKWY